MAYSKSTDWIKEQILARNIVAYKITDERKNTIAENDQLTPDLVVSELDGILPNLTGLIHLQLSPKNKAEKAAGGTNTKQDITIPIQLSADSKPIGAIHQPQQPTVDHAKIYEEMENRFNARLQIMEMQNKHALEIADLKRQLAEAQETNPVIKMLEPQLPQIISGLLGNAQPRPMAGINEHANEVQPVEVQQVEVSEDEHGAAENAISRLLTIDPDFINVLQRLAKLAEQNIDMYNMAKGMLPPL